MLLGSNVFYLSKFPRFFILLFYYVQFSFSFYAALAEAFIMNSNPSSDRFQYSNFGLNFDKELLGYTHTHTDTHTDTHTHTHKHALTHTHTLISHIKIIYIYIYIYYIYYIYITYIIDCRKNR